MSLYSKCSSYANAGYNSYSCYITIDLKAKKILRLNDVFNPDNPAFIAFISHKISETMMSDLDDYESFNDLSSKEKLNMIKKQGLAENLNDFYITKDDENSFVIDFIEEKDWGAKHDTSLSVTIPLESLKPFLADDFKILLNMK